MLEIQRLKHSKEVTYFTIMLIFSILAWIPLIFLIIYIIPIAIGLWLTGLYFRAIILGDSVRVSPKQFPEIYEIANLQCQRLGMRTMPEVFIYNGNGIINAIAIRFLSRKYVILMSELVDLMLSNGSEGKKELSMVIGHELGHHAAGHTEIWKNLLLLPGKYIPFIGNAYLRACELTADRIGYALIEDLDAAQNSLVRLALGSKNLANQIDIESFIEQERDIPELMGFIYKLYSSHPRMTVRVTELAYYHNSK